MIYLLDTNVCIHLLNHRHSSIERHFRACLPTDIFLCSIVKAELLYGAKHSQRIEANLQKLIYFFKPLKSFVFDDACAHIYAKIRHQLSSKGGIIGPNDLMIASIALTHDAVLVTHNTKEFSRVQGLQLVDWEC